MSEQVSRCPKCGEVTAIYPDGGGIVINPSGHACKGTSMRTQQDAARLIGWMSVNKLYAAGFRIVDGGEKE